MFYMVNPSDAPKRKKKRARRNPELLIVNPYDGNKKTRRKKMAKKKRKRKNPVRRRKNPIETITSFLKGKSKDAGAGPLQSNVVRALVAGAGGGAAMAFGAAVAGKRLGETNVAQAVVGIGGGLLGAGVLGLAGKKLKQPALLQAAPLVAAGALTLSVWELVRDPVVEQIGKVRDTITGVGEWENEFAGLGQSYWDEFPKKGGPQGSTVAGWGLGQNPELDEEENPFLGMAGYEPMGDIMGSQRLGSFELEGYGGMGGHEPEAANVMHQQIADQAKHKAGLMGYETYGSSQDWDDDIGGGSLF
jgi:hypothetical protein